MSAAGIPARNGSGRRAASASSIPASTRCRSSPRSCRRRSSSRAPTSPSRRTATRRSPPRSASGPPTPTRASPPSSTGGRPARRPGRSRSRPRWATGSRSRMAARGSRSTALLDVEHTPHEYEDIYDRFAELLRDRRSLVDAAPAPPRRRRLHGRPAARHRSLPRLNPNPGGALGHARIFRTPPVAEDVAAPAAGPVPGGRLPGALGRPDAACRRRNWRFTLKDGPRPVDALELGRVQRAAAGPSSSATSTASPSGRKFDTNWEGVLGRRHPRRRRPRARRPPYVLAHSYRRLHHQRAGRRSRRRQGDGRDRL